MAGDAAAGDILIHHPAAHADEIILRPLANLGDRDRIEWLVALGQERVGDRDLERGRGAQARADRDVAPDDEIGAGKGPSAHLQHDRHAKDIVGPVAARGAGRVEIELARLVHDHGINPEAPIRALRGGGQGGEFERRRHDESVVIVRMLADQIDAARRTADRRRATESDRRTRPQGRAPQRSSEFLPPAYWKLLPLRASSAIARLIGRAEARQAHA